MKIASVTALVTAAKVVTSYNRRTFATTVTVAAGPLSATTVLAGRWDADRGRRVWEREPQRFAGDVDALRRLPLF
jgi:hypothetical protein